MDFELQNEDSPPIPTTPTHFVPMRRPHGSRQAQNRVPRPHSIGASIISNPKLVKGWSYYDNSPQPKSIQKYFSTINLPPEGHQPEDFNETATANTSTGGSGGRRVNTIHIPEEMVPSEADAMIGVEIKAVIAEDEDQGLCQHFLGIILTILGSSTMALTTVFVKSVLYDDEVRGRGVIPWGSSSFKTYEKYNPYTVSLWAFQGLLLPSLLVYLLSRGWKVTMTKSQEELRIDYLIQREKSSCRRLTSRGSLTFLRGVFGWLCMVLEIEAIEKLMNSNGNDVTTTAIIFTFPVVAVIGAWILLRENVSVISIISAAVVVLGVGIILKPPFLTGEADFKKTEWIGCSMAVGSMLLTALITLVLRRIRDVHFALVNFIFGLIGTVGGIAICIFMKESFFPDDKKDWLLAMSIAGLFFIGHSLLTLALKSELVGTFAVVRTIEVPIAFFLEALFLERSPKPHWWSLIGAALIILGVFIISLRKWVEARPNSRQIRRLLGFLLI